MLDIKKNNKLDTNKRVKKQVTEREKISMTNTIDNDIFRIHNNISYESIRKIENPVKKN